MLALLVPQIELHLSILAPAMGYGKCCDAGISNYRTGEEPHDGQANGFERDRSD